MVIIRSKDTRTSLLWNGKCYQTFTVTAIKVLRDFLNKPNKENYYKVDGALKVVMQETAAINKYAKKKASGQLEMDL